MAYKFYSPLSVSECVQRLKANVWETGASYKDMTTPLLGRVDEQGFSVRRATGLRNAFAPYFNGTFRASGGGTVIEGDFGLSSVAQVFAIVWVFLWLGITCSLAAMAGFTLLLFYTIAGEVITQLDADLIQALRAMPVVAVSFPIIGLAFGIGFPLLFTLLRRGDQEWILALLKRQLSAH